MAKRAEAPKKDVDYTIAGLLAIVAIVLFTAMFFRGNSPGLEATGQAYEAAVAADIDVPDECEASSFCDGTRLVRRHSDCNQYIAFCQYGCEELSAGAQCR